LELIAEEETTSEDDALDLDWENDQAAEEAAGELRMARSDFQCTQKDDISMQRQKEIGEQRAREDAYESPRSKEWKKYRPNVPRDQVPEHLRDLWDDAHTFCRPLWVGKQDQDQEEQETERRRVQLLDNQNQVFGQILESKDPVVRAALWRRLIRQANYTGDGLSREVSKMYLCWFRTACLNRDATLELDDVTGRIGWDGIRCDVRQLTEWIVQRIIREPIEQRLNMIQKCDKHLLFTEDQQQRLQTSIFSPDILGASRYVKMFRKALEMEVFGWTSLVNILKKAVDHWGLRQIKRLTKESFDQSEFRTFWSRLCQFSDISMQLQGRLESREMGITLPKGSDRTYFKWVKSLTNPKERAKAMILLQRTGITKGRLGCAPEVD
jgi:hypothetical protein